MYKGQVIFVNKKKKVGKVEDEFGQNYFFKLEGQDVEEGDKVRFNLTDSELRGLLGTERLIATNITK